MGLYALGKSSNRSTRNFDILVKLKTIRTIPLFQAKVLYNTRNFSKYHYDLSVSRILYHNTKIGTHVKTYGKRSFFSKSLVCPITLSIFTVKITFRQVLLSHIVI